MRLARLVTLVVVLAAGQVSVSAQRAVILVRHAERADSVPTSGPMLSSVDPPLSDAGQARAVALADLLAEAGIGAVYASEYKRAQDTARPLAARIGLPVQISPSTAVPMLLGRLRSEHPDAVVFIVGHSNTIPDFMRAFGISAPPEIAEDEYDNLFIVTPATRSFLTLKVHPAPPGAGQPD